MNSDKQFKCPVCGTDESPDSKFCGECGSKIEAQSEQKPNTDSLAVPVKEDFTEVPREIPRPQYTPVAPPPPALDPQTKPLGVFDYILMVIGFSLPVIGLILMIVWSVSSTTNVNRKNFARAYLILCLVAVIISVIISISITSFVISIFNQLVDSGALQQFGSDFGSRIPSNFFDMSIMRSQIAQW